MNASPAQRLVPQPAASPDGGAGLPAPGDARVLTLQQAAHETGRNPELLRRWCVAGRIRARRVGRDWLVSRDELPRIVDMPRRGQGRLNREIDLGDRELLGPGVNAELDDCLEPDEEVRVILPGVDDSALVATDRRVFLARDGVLVSSPQSDGPMAWQLDSMRRVQLEMATSSAALVVTQCDPDGRAVVLLVARPHLARAETAADALRSLILNAD